MTRRTIRARARRMCARFGHLPPRHQSVGKNLRLAFGVSDPWLWCARCRRWHLVAAQGVFVLRLHQDEP